MLPVAWWHALLSRRILVILVVDDDLDMRALVRDALEREGFAVEEASDGQTALTKIAAYTPELVILDLNLPKVRGLDVLREVRGGQLTPVIVLSGLGDEADRVVGLELGADDYIVKPFSPRELVARVRSVLRRASDPLPQKPLDFGRLRVDLTSREVYVDDALVPLRRLEFDLLAFFCSSPRQVFSREQLLVNVWHSAPDWQDLATVSEHIHRLRTKIEANPSEPRLIITVRGVGYRFEP
jgi:two-component system, OmpR family, phosphate regulon response regulator PhoB